ncbi:MAG: site-specific integrase [Scytolyngbya sp. HA4215-MV1]|jgi:integrase|nr:site-specific integrase [Scytolyngbya sp. HA4215-MV1]
MKFSLGKDKGNYRIDFTLDERRKRFYPGTSDELTAKNILRRMEFDWEQGHFDLTLQSYKLKNRPQTSSKPGSSAIVSKKTDVKLLTLWDRWVESLNLPLRVQNDHYHCCRAMISKVDPIWDDLTWFLQSGLSASTWNTRRRFIKSCISWALDERLIDGKNHWLSLKARRNTKTDAKPFTKAEVQKIIQAFESNQFCSVYSPCKHSYYAPYLKFLLLTGVRPGEAIALQWKHVDFDRNLIEISEAMTRDLEYSPYTSHKIRKSTKTGETRYLPINDTLRKVLVAHKPKDSKLDALVFPGARSKGTLDIDSFRKVWKQVLTGLGIDYRKPYNTKHTALSQIAQDHGLLAAAKVAGHKSLDMVSRHYARFTGDLKDVMPKFTD